MKSERFTATLRVFRWVAFYFLLCVPALFLADANLGNGFVIH